MKYTIYGITGLLVISASSAALANAAPAMQAQPPAVTSTEATTRTEVVSETTLYGQQIAATLVGIDKASIFRDLLQQNGLSVSLRQNGSGYTAFVPVNEAFANMTIAPPQPGQFNPELRRVLENHVVDAKFDVNLLHGQHDRIQSLSGQMLTVSKAGRGYYVNGQPILDRMHTPEGIIYFIAAPLNASPTNAAFYNPADARK
jgi:uncharacterized surface protein with fasciclin (FAS1) repeats